MLNIIYKGFVRAIVFLLLLVGMFTWTGCGGGGGEEKLDILPPGATEGFRPFIISVEPKVASAGSQITILGRYFGTTQGDSTATLNGIALTIVTWSDTKIEAILPQEASSGMIVITVKGRASQSSSNAQIFIGSAPPAGPPIITGLSQYSGYPGVLITVYGQNFGQPMPTDGRVLFKSQVGEVEAEVRPIEGVEGAFRWYSTSIQVKVPQGAITGPVVVEVGGVRSNNNFVFQVEPEPPPPSNQPIEINSFAPTEGPLGTIVRITGNYFGHSRGGGVVQLSGINLEILFWSNTEIYVKIVAPARSGNLVVVARGFTDRTTSPFVVIQVPELTGVSPSRVQSGRPMRLYGRNFGADAGSIILKPDVPANTPADVAARQRPTTISGNAISLWSDTELRIDRLPKLNSEPGFRLKVEVLNELGQSSDDPLSTGDDIYVDLVSDVIGAIDVLVDIGQSGTPEIVKQTIGLANLTNFIFRVTPGGGIAPYRIELDLKDGAPLIATDVTGVYETTHIFFGEGNYQGIFARITDVTGDTNVVTGPDITIVPQNQPVITRITIKELDAVGDTDFRPNDYVGKYFAYHNGALWNFGDNFLPVVPPLRLQPIGAIVPNDDEIGQRNYQRFKAERRPIGYRVRGGSLIQIQGYNFDKGDGGVNPDVLFRAETEFPLLMNFLANPPLFEPEAISIRMPTAQTVDEALQTLGGDVRLQFMIGGSEFRVTAPTPFVPAPQIVPDPTPVPSLGSVILNVYDSVPDPSAGGFIGDKVYLFFAFPAQIDTGGAPLPYPGIYLLPIGFELTNAAPGFITFSFDIGQNIVTPTQDPNVGWPARNPNYPATDSNPLVVVDPVPGTWFVFMWSGVNLTSDPEKLANSGIISNAGSFTVTP